VFIGRETLDGRRVIHLHAAATGPVIDRVQQWVDSLEGRDDIEVRSRMDPTWEILDRW